MQLKGVSGVILVLLCLGSQTLYAAPCPKDSNLVLQVKGLIYCDGVIASGVHINVYEDNDFVFAQKSNILGRFSIELDLGKHYTLELSRPGLITKRIVFKTTIPDKVKHLEIYPMDVELFWNNTNKDISELDYPVGVIQWIGNLNTFHDYVPYSNKMRALQFDLLGVEEQRGL